MTTKHCLHERLTAEVERVVEAENTKREVKVLEEELAQKQTSDALLAFGIRRFFL